jgi:hypothetical protein
MPNDVSDVDTQTKLKRFLRNNDRRNTMSMRFLDKVAETREAQELIEKNKSLEDAEIKRKNAEELRSRAERNKASSEQEKRYNESKGRLYAGTHTTKKGERRSLFKLQSGEIVYEDKRGNYRNPETGRFTSKE